MPFGPLASWMPLGTFLAFLSLSGVGVSAWTDIKEDLAVAKERYEHTTREYRSLQEQIEKTDKKIDKIYDYLLNQPNNHPVEEDNNGN